jgi:predicted amidohydrolase
MRAAALQYFATPFQLERNLETAERLVRQAAAQGAQLALLPECFNTGYVYSRRWFAAAEDSQGPTLRWLGGLSAELGLHLAGALLLRDGPRLFDTLVLVQPNGEMHRYRKQHPFLWERCYFEAGRGPLVAETPLGRFGMLVCWDAAQASAWEAYHGRMDWLLVASAPPRLHRAVLNFPQGRKVYLAQLLPALLRDREALDGLFEREMAARAAWLGVPVVHAAMSGRFVTEVPLARWSFLGAAAARPRYWSWISQAHLASLRATFYGGSAIYNANGETLARVESEEGVALADLSPAPANAPASPASATPPPFTRLPAQVRLLAWLLRPLAARYYRLNR